MTERNTNLSLTLVSAESVLAETDWLHIVQPEWREPSDSDFAAWMAARGYGFSMQTLLQYWSQFKSHCLSSGSLEVELEVHKSRPDLDYVMNASYGELSECRLDVVDHKLSITIEGKSSHDLEQMVVGPYDARWEGAVLDVATKSPLIPPPPISIVNGVITFGGYTVVGVIRLAYTEEHDAYTLTIEPRPAGDYDPTDIETAYQSTAIAIWGLGNIESHEVDLPNMSGSCDGGGSVRVNPDDPEQPEEPDGDCYDLYITKHRCTGEVLNERKVAVPCPEQDEEQ